MVPYLFVAKEVKGQLSKLPGYGLQILRFLVFIFIYFLIFVHDSVDIFFNGSFNNLLNSLRLFFSRVNLETDKSTHSAPDALG